MNADEIKTELLTLIRKFAPSRGKAVEIDDDLQLYKKGLALDSLAMIELLLTCQEKFEIEFPPEYMEGGDFTIANLIGQISADE